MQAFWFEKNHTSGFSYSPVYVVSLGLNQRHDGLLVRVCVCVNE